MEPDEPRRERRLHPREIVLKEATIVAGPDNPAIGCSVRNQHERGAELRVPSDAVVPERFLLHVPDDAVTYQTVVRWRRKERLGVQFYGAPKPSTTAAD
ncbi:MULTISPECIES: PilZ domain-containing protein [Mesorhizobium]|uniref:PilZ domain-containing protein n=1 Tax=Mesorhizobium abyssinicae TaxID=1209958 RepID=A0ABU5AJT7_9HYPH|nr:MULTISPECIES: PilZ domain-containing protein [Mesorhizobium]RVC59987.1 PilZ domain-containing protein [Mesorhizobium sp. M4B.F.Ca.ET.088.02.2.1]MDX8537552.1 PilZ domain-containing protein [Mesorhizobium abyssinicae]RWA64289.1 MAG: PilZ domain-containing protein [Mesorhizobium sp.]RWC95627.1 MAG: PilZ domain-containing protein [Mesorhizobium sp.]RWF32445.1 MAG: PilZ domain-containing protein [Mesorhizobium sp.]